VSKKSDGLPEPGWKKSDGPGRSPWWNKSDVLPGKNYRVQLCHSDGHRFYELLEDGSDPSPWCVFTTEVVPARLLVNRDVTGIAEEVPLRGGERFRVDAHCVWFTESEAAAFVAALRSGEGYDAIEWVTGVPPKFAPK
jgi:hypothetical protein